MKLNLGQVIETKILDIQEFLSTQARCKNLNKDESSSKLLLSFYHILLLKLFNRTMFCSQILPTSSFNIFTTEETFNFSTQLKQNLN